MIERRGNKTYKYYQKKEALICASIWMFLLILIVIVLILSQGCCRTSQCFQKDVNWTWERMQEKIPECFHKDLPEIAIIKMEGQGICYQNLHLILLNSDTRDVLEHELKHSCGLMLGER